MSNKDIDILLSILNNASLNEVDNLDDKMKKKLKNIVNYMINVKVSMIPYTTLIQFRDKLNNEQLQERAHDLSPNIKLNIDSDGNLLITKKDNVDFRTIFNNSHILLREYGKVNNIDGIKYELCKLYMIVSIINEKYVHSNNLFVNTSKKKEMTQLKSFIMQDFYTYIRILLKDDNQFNFNDYFSQTQFGIETYKIDNKVLKGLKHIIF